MKRAYSLLTIKSIDEDKRVLEGIATTPTADRLGDIVEPDGAEYKLPLPLLWQHNSREPIGHVEAAKVTKDGISIRARLAKVDEPGALKNRLDDAWQTLKAGLVRGLSIGFAPIESADIKGTLSQRFIKWDWLELSCVTIPANAEASIISIKSADQALLAASGHAQREVVHLKSTPGASGSNPKGKTVKTIQEQISALEAKRAASAARREEIQGKAIEAGRTKDEAEKQEFDTISAEIKAIDDELVDLKLMEAQAVSKAKPITNVVDPASGSAARGGYQNTITVRPNVEKGIGFVRGVMALATTRGNVGDAVSIAQNNKSWMDTTPEVVTFLKASVAGGDTTTAGWAAELVYAQNLVNDFIDILRPMTIIGRIPNLTRVPFNVRIAGASSGTSAFWVGQGKPIPVSKMVTTATTLGIAKAGGLVVLTKELVRSSSPSAELMVRNDLTGSISQFLDQQFIDPNFAPVTNVSPGSITYGVTGLTPTGTTSATLRADVQTLFGQWIAQNLDPSKGVWVMPASTALSISLMLNALGQPVFPSINMTGGTFFGLPVITSQTATVTTSPETGSLIVLINAPEIMLADDGGIEIDASGEASVEQLDNPTNNAAAGTNTTMVSMFQTSSVAIKAVRFINWAKRRTTAVRFIQQAAYIT